MIVGIDLGTTNSLIAYLKDGVPTIIPNSHGKFLTPSVVGMDDAGTVLVGATAKERLLKYSDNTVASFKRLMGSQQVVKLGTQKFKPEELSALVLRSLKADAEAALGHEISEAIISVPAYFNDQQRKATRIAGELAGFKVNRLINEPTAAALFHGIQEREAEAKFLVFDLGGGTFDVSILEKFDGVMEVRATGGDSFLGGDDFTKALQDLFMQKAGIDTKQKEVLAAIHFAAEEAKRKLNEQPSAEMQVVIDGVAKSQVITQEAYEQQCKPLLDRLRLPVERALRDARLRVADLDEVVLVGGATRMSMVRKLAAQLFGRLPARYVDPDQTIALGGAVCAGLSMRHQDFREVVLTDVCPHSLGMEVVEQNAKGHWEQVFMPIIERNTVIPASRQRSVVTVSDRQTALKVTIYQGESRSCSNNVLLGELEIRIPLRPAGGVTADVRYTYDINGILDVDVDIENAGISRNMVIKKLAGNVSDEEIARRRQELAALKVHPRDQADNRLLMERAERLYEQLLGDEREKVGYLLGQFRAVLNSQVTADIAEAHQEIWHALDAIEHRNIW
ncbi:MAG TPA: molecular chaperone HscC [Gallionellaceae bacterium]